MFCKEREKKPYKKENGNRKIKNWKKLTSRKGLQLIKKIKVYKNLVFQR